MPRLYSSVLILSLILAAFYISLDVAIWATISWISFMTIVSVFVAKTKVPKSSPHKPIANKFVAIWSNIFFGTLVGVSLALITILIFVLVYPEYYQ